MKKTALTIFALALPSLAQAAPVSASAGCYTKQVIAAAVLPILERDYHDAIIDTASLKFSLLPEQVVDGASPLVIVIDMAFKNARTGKFEKRTWSTQYKSFDYKTCTPSQTSGMTLLW